MIMRRTLAPKYEEAYDGVFRYLAEHEGLWRSTSQVSSALVASGAITPERAVRSYRQSYGQTDAPLGYQVHVGANRIMNSVLKCLHSAGRVRKRPGPKKEVQWSLPESTAGARTGRVVADGEEAT